MKIPVIVVDDERVDRYTAKRRLERHGGFEPGMNMLCERFRLVEVLNTDRQDD